MTPSCSSTEKRVDLHFQPLAAAPDQRAVRLQRRDQRQDGADVVVRGIAQQRQRRAGQHGADAVAGEELHQHRAVGTVDRGNARGRRRRGRRARAPGSTRATSADCVDLPVSSCCDLVGGQRVDQFAVLVDQARRVAQEDQLVGLDRHRHRLGHFLPGAG